MKPNFLFLFFLSICFFCSCAENISEKTENFPFGNPAQASNIVPMDHPVFDILYNPDNYTWTDLDKFYREKITAEENMPYFNTLKLLTIGYLVDKYKLAEAADKKTQEYYLTEWSKTDFIDPQYVSPLLKNMEGYWPAGKVQEWAVSEHDRNMKFIKDRFNPQDVLDRREAWSLFLAAFVK